jgi:hypothetical protein
MSFPAMPLIIPFRKVAGIVTQPSTEAGRRSP